jgi:hypothetical protein
MNVCRRTSAEASSRARFGANSVGLCDRFISVICRQTRLRHVHTWLYDSVVPYCLRGLALEPMPTMLTCSAAAQSTSDSSKVTAASHQPPPVSAIRRLDAILAAVCRSCAQAGYEDV